MSTLPPIPEMTLLMGAKSRSTIVGVARMLAERVMHGKERKSELHDGCIERVYTPTWYKMRLVKECVVKDLRL